MKTVERMCFSPEAPLRGWRWFAMDEEGRLFSPAFGVAAAVRFGLEFGPGWNQAAGCREQLEHGLLGKPTHTAPGDGCGCGWSGYWGSFLSVLLQVPHTDITDPDDTMFVAASVEFAGDVVVTNPEWLERPRTEIVRAERARLAGPLWVRRPSEQQLHRLRADHPDATIEVLDGHVHEELWNRHGRPVLDQPYDVVQNMHRVARFQGFPPMAVPLDPGVQWPRSTGSRAQASVADAPAVRWPAEKSWVDDYDPGWVVCTPCGDVHRGRNGVAGVVLCRRDADGRWLVLLQLRSRMLREAGTWSIPGGPIGDDETPEQAAFRELQVQTGLTGAEQVGQIVDVHWQGWWAYTTVVADYTGDQPDALGVNWQTAELRWVPADEVADLPLHSAFAATWPAVRRRVEGHRPSPRAVVSERGDGEAA